MFVFLQSCGISQTPESVWYPWEYGVDDPLLWVLPASFDEVYDGLARMDTSCKDEFQEYYDWYINESKGSDVMTDFHDLVRAQDGDCVIWMSTVSQWDNAWIVQKFDVENQWGTFLFFEICRADRKENGQYTPCGIDELSEFSQKYQEFISGASDIGDDLWDRAFDIPYFDDVYETLWRTSQSCQDHFRRYYSMFFPYMEYIVEDANFYDLFEWDEGQCLLWYSYKQDDNIFWRVVEIPDGDIDFDDETVVFYTECISGIDENNEIYLCDAEEIEKTHLLYQNFMSNYQK